jgi:hypothetical protein
MHYDHETWREEGPPKDTAQEPNEHKRTDGAHDDRCVRLADTNACFSSLRTEQMEQCWDKKARDSRNFEFICQIAFCSKSFFPRSAPFSVLTRNFERPGLWCFNNIHPQGPQHSNTNDGWGTDQQSQTKQDGRQEQVIQVKELQIVLDPCHQQGWILFHIKGAFFANTKADTDRSQSISRKELSGGWTDVIFGRIGDTGREVGDGLTGTGRIPFFLASNQARGAKEGM